MYFCKMFYQVFKGKTIYNILQIISWPTENIFKFDQILQ